MKKILLLLILLFSEVFASNIPSYLILIEYNQQNVQTIKNHNIPVLHQSENYLIIVADDTSLKFLQDNNITVQNIGLYSDSKDYFLTNKKNAYDEISFSDLSGLMFSNNEFAIVQTSAPQDIIKKGFTASKLKIMDRIPEPNPLILPIQTASNSDSLITQLIREVNQDSVKYWIESLQSFKTRFMLADNRKAVAEWIRKRFIRFGFSNAHLDSFYVYNSWQYNVVATLNSSTSTDKVFVVGGHHDSISRNNPYLVAPGADDNASGTAAVLEIARILMKSDYQLEANILFTTYAGEEYGLFGSQYFAEQAKQNGMNIQLMINHDMIATSPNNPSSSSVTINHYTGSEKFTDLALSTIKKFTVLNSVKGDLNANYSDSYSFWVNDFKTIYFEETQFSSVYHTDNDLISYCNIPYCTEVIKASCAVLINSIILPESIHSINITDSQNGTAIHINWEKNSEPDFAYYKIYIGLSSGNYYKSFTTSDNHFTISNLEAGKKYFIGVSTVDLTGNESFIYEESFVPINFTLDKGILVIDETYDGNGSLGRPSDIEVDELYKRVLKNFSNSSYDVVEMNGVSAVNMAPYSTVIWHGDDFVNLSVPYSIQKDIKRFLQAGGKFIYSGYTPSKAFDGNYKYPAIYKSGDFLYDVLKIEKVEKYTGSKFFGAISTSLDLPYIQIDSTKIPDSYNLHISNIEAIYPNVEANVLYLFDTKYDTSTVMGSMYKKPVGIEYLGNDYKLVVLSYPLYFMDESSVQKLLQKVLSEHFDEPTEVSSQGNNYVFDFVLSQNYPNPFNPRTTIEFSIPDKMENSHVELKVYDALGREIAILISEPKQAGSHKVIFDGSNFASGLYYYRLKVGESIQIKKMILLK